MTRYYPAFLDLEGRLCVVVGGGAVAARKVEALLECGARVTVVSPALDPVLEATVSAGRTNVVRREYVPGDLEGAFLVIAASDDREANARVASEARERGVLVNAVDDPEHCDFIVPAVVRQGDLAIAISTAGRSPALAKYLRRYLEALFAAEYADLLNLVAEAREELRSTGTTVAAEVWQDVLSEEPLALLRQGRREEAKRRLIRKLLAATGSQQRG